jgi:hypothetical protein
VPVNNSTCASNDAVALGQLWLQVGANVIGVAPPGATVTDGANAPVPVSSGVYAATDLPSSAVLSVVSAGGQQLASIPVAPSAPAS